MQLQPNITFDSHYTLIRQLGRGGFSEVWLAHDSYMDFDVALKIYAPGQGMDEHSIDELRREIKVVFTLNHTNLLKPSYLGVWNGMPYLVLAYCSRGSLTQQIGKLPEQELWHVLHDVAAGLAYLHKNDIVHQDIKPDNILLDDSGNYVITDFGISTKARSTLRKSVIGGAVSGGTMAYMGPERFSKQPAPTKASDIWSLGAMMFELVTGYVPFGENGGVIQNSGAEIPEITENISSELKTTIEQMLSLNTWDRPTAEKVVPLAQKQMNRPHKEFPIESEEYPIGDDLVIDSQAANGRETERFPKTAQPVISISEDSFNSKAEGGWLFVGVTCQNEWTSTKSYTVSWLHVHKKSNGVSIKCDKNKTGETRTAHVYIKSGNEQKSICVTQPSLPKSIAWVVWLMLACVFSIGILGIPLVIGIKQHIEEIRLGEAKNDNDSSPQMTVRVETTEEEGAVKKDVDRARIERLISNICKNSGKGGDYNALQSYFASSIYPHPSGEARSNYNIGEQTKNYVERFNEYEISTPFNFTYSGTTFPLTVKCDISVTWTLKDGTSKRAWIHKTYYVNSEYKVTGYTDEEYNREILQASPFASGYSLKADIYYRIVFDVNSTLPVYSNESCSGQPSFYLYKGSSFVVLHSKKILYSAQLLTITRVLGKAFPDCVDNGYNAGDKLYILESVEEGYNIVLNGTREEYACFSIQGEQAVARYDGCNMIEGNVSGYEKSIVTMQIKVTKNGTGTGYVRFEYDRKAMKSDWGSVATYWNKDYNS